MSKYNEKPLIVLKYHKGKMLGRFIFFWGPMMLMCAVMIYTAIQESNMTMLFAFLLVFAGSLFHWLVTLNVKSFELYNDCIVKYRVFNNAIKYELQEAGYNNYAIWPREMIVITSQNQKKSLAIFYGFIKQSNMKQFYKTLSQLTGESPEKLDCGCVLRFNINK